MERGFGLPATRILGIHIKEVRFAGLTGAFAAAAAVMFAPAASAAEGVDGTCPLALTRLDPTTTNALALDTNAVYWVAGYTAVPGTRIRVEGQFPHSRFMGFNLYDGAARPLDAIADRKIKPERRSTNPFEPGADRFAERRDYSLTVEFGPRPEKKVPRNTLYSGDSRGGTLWYRVYIPDNGRDPKGGVPLPRITYEGGPALPSADACRELQAPYLEGLNEAIAGSPGLPDLTGDGSGYPGRNPPDWRLFRNFGQAATEIMLNNETGEPLYEDVMAQQSDSAGFFASSHIAYVFTGTSRGFGELLVIRARAPTFADTRDGPATMPSGEQLRYWSLCQYEPATQRVIDCRSDDRIEPDADGTFTVVVSSADHRPACARNWIPWGPTQQGLVIYRHLLADPSFANAIQRVPEPGSELEVMGEYYPAAQYLPDAATYESQYCPAG
jgi:hypothetical protein